jgi:uncharacterized membrane protein YjjP (DUF1212 family)
MWQPQCEGPWTEPLQDRANLVLTSARLLHINGQSTEETIRAVERLGRALGLSTALIPRWGELQLQVEEGPSRLVTLVKADPVGIDMARVSATMRAIESITRGELTVSAGASRLRSIARMPPAPMWLFTLASAAGAAALAVIFGVRHVSAVGLIVASAAAGAVVRRLPAVARKNPLLPAFCAAFIAGVVGAFATRQNLSSALRLVAVCPCTILVPGAHVLNGMLDLASARVHLGASRLVYAVLVLMAISAGLLGGLALLHVSLPVDAPGRSIPLWLDAIAAGAAATAFTVFFSVDMSTLGWPVGIGMLAHGLRWWTVSRGFGVATGAAVASLAVGLLLTPVARRWHMPFAAIGFASVVSLMPGVLLFRMTSGLVELTRTGNTTLELIQPIISDGMTATSVILGISLGLVVSKLTVDTVTGIPV